MLAPGRHDRDLDPPPGPGHSRFGPVIATDQQLLPPPQLLLLPPPQPLLLPPHEPESLLPDQLLLLPLDQPLSAELQLLAPELCPRRRFRARACRFAAIRARRSGLPCGSVTC